MKYNLIHNCIHYCNGYQKFLSNVQYGNIFQFNLQYFLFPYFWLIRHKMYFLLFFTNFSLFSVFAYIFSLTHNTEISIQNSLTPLFCIHLIFTFLSHKAYYLHIDNKFNKVNYQYNKCLKIAEPFPWYINIILGITFFALNFIFIFGIVYIYTALGIM